MDLSLLGIAIEIASLLVIGSIGVYKVLSKIESLSRKQDQGLEDHKAEHDENVRSRLLIEQIHDKVHDK